MERELTQQEISQQPVGVVSVAEVLLYFSQDRYLSKRLAAAYLCLSLRNFESRLDQLPRYRVGSKLLFKKSELDRWMEAHRESNGDSLARIMHKSLKKGPI